MTSADRGYGHKWRQYRLAYLSKHPLCEGCRKQAIVTAASVVDHIVPHQGDPRLFWDENNHQALCKPCHDVVKAAEERSAGYR